MNAPDIRAGDDDRQLALDRLGEYFADGYLEIGEFEERTGRAAVATTRSELESLFDDLPTRTAAPTPVAQEAANQAELDKVKRKNRLVRGIDGAVMGVAMAVFFIGLFVFNWTYFWAVFPAAAFILWGVRGAVGLSDSDEKFASELEKKEAGERAQRLRQAAERRRELGK